MSNWWLFLFAVIPPVFFVFYIYKRDNKRPEPKGSIFRVFLLGVLSCIVVLLVSIPFLSFSTFLEENPLGYAIFNAFILAGFSHIFFLGIYPVLIFGLRDVKKKIKLALQMDEERNIPVSNPIW